MLRIETLIIDIDRLHELLQVVSFAYSTPERLLAHRTTDFVDKPLLNALTVEDVVAIEHAADRFIFNWLQADRAFSCEELARFEPDQDFLDVDVAHLFVPFLQQSLSLGFAPVSPFDPSEFTPLLLFPRVGPAWVTILRRRVI